MFFRQLDKFPQRLHGLLELLGKLLVLLVLPGVAQRREARVQQDHAVVEVAVEALQFLGELPHFFRIHDCLRHVFAFVECLPHTIANRRRFAMRGFLKNGISAGRHEPLSADGAAKTCSMAQQLLDRGFGDTNAGPIRPCQPMNVLTAMDDCSCFKDAEAEPAGSGFQS